MLGHGETRHPSGPVDLVGAELGRLVPDHVGQAGLGVALQDLRRPVDRRVVGDDEEVDAERAVVAQVVLDDVRLVADLERHDQAHGR
jgi:hypothetical protein